MADSVRLQPDWQHHGIERILPRQDAANRQAIREHRRHVLAAVNRKVDFMAEERFFDFLDEQPLAADFRQRRLLQAIP